MDIGRSLSTRLTPRKLEVAAKPTTMHSWSSEEYVAIHAAAAAARQLVRQKSAYPACPYASDDSAYDSSDRDSSCLSPSDSGISIPPAQLQPEPPEKVNYTYFGAEAYSRAAAANAAAKQQRHDAAAHAPSPFAVSAGEGGMALAPSDRVYHLNRKQDEVAQPIGFDATVTRSRLLRKPQAEPAERIGFDPAAPRLLLLKKKHSALAGKVGANDGPLAAAPSSGPVTPIQLAVRAAPVQLAAPAAPAPQAAVEAPWDAREAAEECRQRKEAQVAARRRNSGTPGLIA